MMTYSEARNVLSNINFPVQRADGKSLSHLIEFMAILKADEALSYRIGRKADIQNGKIGKCPICGTVQCRTDLSLKIITDLPKYCEECGQKLDWSNV